MNWWRRHIQTCRGCQLILPIYFAMIVMFMIIAFKGCAK